MDIYHLVIRPHLRRWGCLAASTGLSRNSEKLARLTNSTLGGAQKGLWNDLTSGEVKPLDVALKLLECSPVFILAERTRETGPRGLKH
jgi:hypothetical protein